MFRRRWHIMYGASRISQGEMKTPCNIFRCNPGANVLSAWFEADVQAPLMQNFIDEIVHAVKTRSGSENEVELAY
jgi:uncharacterized protein YacL (UPF0231 family)